MGFFTRKFVYFINDEAMLVICDLIIVFRYETCHPFSVIIINYKPVHRTLKMRCVFFKLYIYLLLFLYYHLSTPAITDDMK